MADELLAAADKYQLERLKVEYYQDNSNYAFSKSSGPFLLKNNL
jgi:hypothetical protein